jgi:hypothetical protein
MTKLDRAWWAWRELSRADRARFLAMLREAYSREREAVVKAHGGGAQGARVSSLWELTLCEADLRAAMTE